MSQWQTIDSAPKTGKWVLVWWPYVTDVPFVAYCVDSIWHAATSGEIWNGPDPTHWMPLPLPPITEPAREKVAGGPLVPLSGSEMEGAP